MALVLNLQEGRAFYVGDTRVVLNAIQSPQAVKVTVENGFPVTYELTDRDRVEILPKVWAQLGLGSNLTNAKIALEAPKSIAIWRDTLYEERHAQ